MAPTGGYYASPPNLRPHTTFPLLVGIHRILGILFTFCCLVVFICSIPFFILLRCIAYIKKKSRRWNFEKSVCCPNKPITGRRSHLAVMTLDAELTNSAVHEMLNKSKKDPSFHIHNGAYICKEWDRRNRELLNEKDLRAVLNDNDSTYFDDTSTNIYISHGFQPINREKSSSLLIISNPCNTSSLCIQRLICILSNQVFHLEMEPTPTFPSSNGTNFILDGVIVMLRMIAEGPTTIFSLLLQGPNPLWKYLEGGERKYSRLRQGVKQFNHRESSSVLMESVPEDIVVLSGDEISHQHPTSAAIAPLTHRRCWLSIPNGELVGRAERLLRATSGELMLTLVAGTLRSYCREQGILHPPDLGVIMPITCRVHQPVNASEICDTQLFPILLPTSVEGVIPRLWSVQKRLFQGMSGHIPSTLQGTQSLVRSCLPSGAASSFFRSLYSTHAIYFAYYRVGNSSNASVPPNLRSLLLFPSFNANIKASFVFMQYGRETKVCISLCKRTFPDSESILRTFENETILLLDHLSSRLMSLPQSTILPGLPPYNKKKEETTEMYGSSYLRQKSTELAQEKEERQEAEYSLEELHRLLATVQTELDGMRANPEGDRIEYIRKLTELEDKMQRFHQCITQRLGQQGCGKGREGELVDNIFAPYKDGPGSSHQRRFSREFQRTEEQVVRKASRASL